MKKTKFVALLCSATMALSTFSGFISVSAAPVTDDVTAVTQAEGITKGIKLEYDTETSTATDKNINVYAVGYDLVKSGTVSIEVPDDVVEKIESATATSAMSTSITVTSLNTIKNKKFLTGSYAMAAAEDVTDQNGLLFTFNIKLTEDIANDWALVLRDNATIEDATAEYKYADGAFDFESSTVTKYIPTTTPEVTTEPTTTPEVTTEPTTTPEVTTEPTTAPSMIPADPRPTQMPGEATETPEATVEPSAEPTTTPEVTVEPTKAPTPTPITKGIKLEYDTETSTATDKNINVYAVGYDLVKSGTVSIEVPDDVVEKIESATATSAMSTSITVTSLNTIKNKKFLTGSYAMAAAEDVTDQNGLLFTFNIKLTEDIANDWALVLRDNATIEDATAEYKYADGAFDFESSTVTKYVAPVETETPATEAPATEAPATVAPTAAPTEKPIIDTVELSDLVSASAAREAEAVEGAVVYVTTHVTSGNDTLVYGTDYVAKIGNTVLTEKEYTDRIWAYDGNKASDAIDDISLVFYKSADVAAKLNVEGNPYAIDYGTAKVEEPDTPSTQYKFTKWTKTGSSSSITSDSITRGYSRTYMANFNNFDEDTQYIKYEITSGDRYIDLVELADTTKINVEASTVGTARIKATLYDEATDKVLAESTTLSISVKSATSSSGSSSSSGSGSTGGSSIGQIAGGNLGNVSITDPGVINGNVNFQDLDQAAWARDAIVYLAQRGIINGRSSTEFAPNDSITRAEFAQLVINMYGLNKITSANVNVTSNFADVQSGTWYYNAVNIAANLGIVNGYPDGNFYPNNLVSRQEMALMMYRVANKANAKLTAVNEQKVWSDPVADWAADAVTTLQMAGVINGTSDTTFEAEAGATRAQAAQMIYNLYQVIK